MKTDRRAWALAVLLVLGGPGAVRAQPQPQLPQDCILVFGHGRNHDPAQPQQDQGWDQLNLGFNEAVRQPLLAAGHRAPGLVLPVAATDLPANLERLLGEAQRQGCSQVLETTVFGDPQAQALILRLRLYPLLGSKGPRLPATLPQVGAPLYTDQREFDLNARVLERLRPVLLGQEMGQLALPRLAPPAAARPAE